MQTTAGLSNVQKELLKLYEHQVDEEDLFAIRYMLGIYFAGKASRLMDEFIEQQQLSPQDLAKWAYEHYRTHQNRS